MFNKQICKNMEVYVDDVKSREAKIHLANL